MAWRGRVFASAGAAAGSFAAACWWAGPVFADEEKHTSIRRTKPCSAVIVGGGAAGALLAHGLEHMMDVTMVDKKQYFEFTPALKEYLLGEKQEMPLSETSKDWFRKYFVPHQFYLQQSTIITGEVKEVTPKEVILRSGRSLPFDVLFLCTGTEYSAPWKQSNAASVAQRAAELTRYNNMIARSQSVAIIGGGAVGVENAARLAQQHPEKKITLVQSRQHLVPAHGAKLGHYCTRRLSGMGVDVHTLKKVTSVAYDSTTKKFSVHYALADLEGQPLDAAITDPLPEQFDYVMDCRGLKPNTHMLRRHFKSNLDERGFVKVNAYNQLRGHGNIYAVGDIARMPSALGRETGLAYVTDSVSNVCAIFESISRSERPGEGNAIYSYEYPMQLMHLSTYDHFGSVRALGQVRSLVATFAGYKLNEAFLEPFWQPKFKPKLDLAKRARIAEWNAERYSLSKVYEHADTEE